MKLKNINFTAIEDLDINNILESNKISSDEKKHRYFISYLCSDNKVKSLHKMLTKTSAYVKGYGSQIKWMYFLVEDDHLLKKYNTIWDKVASDIKKEFDNESACNRKLKIENQNTFLW